MYMPLVIASKQCANSPPVEKFLLLRPQPTRRTIWKLIGN